MSESIRDRWENCQYSAWQIGYQQEGSSIPYANPYNPVTEPEFHADWEDGAHASRWEDRMMGKHITVHNKELRSVQGFGFNLKGQ